MDFLAAEETPPLKECVEDGDDVDVEEEDVRFDEVEEGIVLIAL